MAVSKWLLAVLACVPGMPCLAQKCVVANAKMNVVYAGVPNPLDVAVAGYECKHLKVTTDNGDIKPEDEACSYIMYPNTAGMARIVVTDVRSAKVLGAFDFRVKYIPDPVAVVAGKRGGIISKDILRVQQGVLAVMEGFDFDARFVVTRFTVTIIRRKNTIYTENCTSPFFTNNTRSAFGKLMDGDTVVITDIRCAGPDSRARVLLPIEFIIQG